ncbi:Exonuclease, partial [Viridothelium virens]
KYVALDCEMVGVGSTPDADSVLARVSVVNYHGTILYDTYVLPSDGVKVTDYRTAISGIQPEHLKPKRTESLVNLKNQPLASLYSVQSTLDALLKDRILIGHALKNDLSALLLSHPHALIRDTSRYAPFRALAGGRTPSLRKLAKQVLGREIQTGEHSSVEDAQAAMDLFKHVRGEWE